LFNKSKYRSNAKYTKSIVVCKENKTDIPVRLTGLSKLWNKSNLIKSRGEKCWEWNGKRK